MREQSRILVEAVPQGTEQNSMRVTRDQSRIAAVSLGNRAEWQQCHKGTEQNRSSGMREQSRIVAVSQVNRAE